MDKHQIDYQFCNFREQTPNAKHIGTWINAIGLDSLINKRSTSWKNLNDKQRQSLSAANAPALIIKYPTLIKRPLLETDAAGKGKIYRAGFSEAEYRAIFA